MKTGWYPFVIARDGTLSYLTVRDLPDGSGVEFGTVACGHQERINNWSPERAGGSLLPRW